MTGLQFDTIVSNQNELKKKVDYLIEKIEQLSRLVGILCSKTVVISDVDKEVEKIKIDVKSLIDEKEA